MLQWKRPSGNDVSTAVFADMYLKPVFGEPDEFGNYIKIIYDCEYYPPTCFTAHYDTVHHEGGFQIVTVEDNVVSSEGDDCLGADCTTGIWLIMEMIDAGIPGVYVVHADEEIGCKGSSSLVASNPDWLDDLTSVISFDRYGDTSIVTHQMGLRTASQDFAVSLSNILGMHNLIPDDTGVYTDSNEYSDRVPECTNISVGYYNQHTSRETQDLVFLALLRDALLAADWSKLVISRDPSDVTELEKSFGYGYYGADYERDLNSVNARQDLYELITAYPDEISEYLFERGITATELAEEAMIDDNKYLSNYLEKEYG